MARRGLRGERHEVPTPTTKESIIGSGGEKRRLPHSLAFATGLAVAVGGGLLFSSDRDEQYEEIPVVDKKTSTDIPPPLKRESAAEKPAITIFFTKDLTTLEHEKRVRVTIGGDTKIFALHGIPEDSAQDALNQVVQKIDYLVNDPKAPQKLRGASIYTVEITFTKQEVKTENIPLKKDEKEKLEREVQLAVDDLFRYIKETEVPKPAPRLNFTPDKQAVDNRVPLITKDGQELPVLIVENIYTNYIFSAAVHGNGVTATINLENSFAQTGVGWSEMEVVFSKTTDMLVVEKRTQTPIIINAKNHKTTRSIPFAVALPVLVSAEVLHAALGKESGKKIEIELASKKVKQNERNIYHAIQKKESMRQETVVHKIINDWLVGYMKQLGHAGSLEELKSSHPIAEQVIKKFPPSPEGARQLVKMYIQHPEQLDALIYQYPISE